MLRMHADATLDAVPAPDIVCVPGGVGVRRELDGPVVSWIRAAHASSTWTTSVCTGSLLLGAAGVLDGLRHEPLAVTRAPSRLRRRSHGRAGRGAGTRDHGGGRLLGDRHGAGPGGSDRRRRCRAGDPALDRVRPAAAV